MSSRAEIVVVGSLNIDYIATVERLPARGETILAGDLIQRFGGKGANQAIAAARQEAHVRMIGCVGADDSGWAYRKRLKREGINVAGLFETNKALTGTALIAVDNSAENLIIVAPGANGHLTPAAVKKQAVALKLASAMLIQFEVPEPTVISAIKLANQLKIPVTLNPSPFRAGFPWGKVQIDTLIVNEHEVESIFGAQFQTAKSAALSRTLLQKGMERVVITRGTRSTICIERERRFEVPALKVKPVDTVGAGDAFAGTFVARRAEGADVLTAIMCANCAGALATLKPGAQESIPTRAATEREIRSLSLPLQGPNQKGHNIRY